MQAIYPIFEQDRILKKEALTAVRDYSYDQLNLMYQEYAPGLLTGGKLTVRENELELSPGILKWQNRILLITEPERIPYTATNCMQYLKARIDIDDSLPDLITYIVTLLLDQSEVCGEHDIELCRFHLRQGAKLRGQYKDFYDLETEYDTINLICAKWGGIGGNTLPPFITQYFADEILKASGKRAEDAAFAYVCLNQTTGIAPAILRQYVNAWEAGNGREADQPYRTSLELYRGLCDILHTAQPGQPRAEAPRKERRKILID